MILKKINPKPVLPEEYHTAQNITDVLLSQLIEILLSKNLYKSLRQTEISFEKEKHNISGLDADQLLQLLIQYDRQSELTTIIAKQLTISLLEDLVDFISESLNACKNGKFSVSYALLRKPMLDELLMLEQILNNKEDFVKRYYIDGDVNLYDPSNKRKFDSLKMSIITESISNLPISSMFTSDFIYDVRYNKDAKHGLNWITNQALHIVTTDSHYRTPNQDLNFVFSITDDYHKYWHHYYSTVTYLLFYITSVVDEIVASLIPDFIQLSNVKSTRRFLAYAVWGEKLKNDKFEDIKGFISNLSSSLEHSCFNCNSFVKLELKDFILFVFTNELKCRSCSKNQLEDKNFVNKFFRLDI